MSFPAKMKIYNKEFNYYSDTKLQAYYHLHLEGHSTKLNRDQYICHIILLTSFRITNYESIFAIEDHAIEELFKVNYNVTKENSVFSLVVEFTEGASIIPDLNMIRNVNKLKGNIETKRNIVLNHAVAIIPKKFGKTFRIFKFIAKYFSKGVEIAMIVNNYDQAIEEIEKIDFIIDTESFNESVR